MFPRPLWLVLPLVVCLGACERRAETQAPPAAERSVRPAAVAGQFYPGEAEQLRAAVAGYLAAASPPALPGEPVALVVPHAGYEFSAATAAYAYKALAGHSYDTVVLLGPSHHVPVAGAALSPAGAWRTPLGEVAVDTELAASLRQVDPDCREQAEAHAQEHSVEVQLPFLQTVLPQARIVPVALGELSTEGCRKLGEGLAELLKGRHALLIASSDLAHYPPRDACAQLDKATLALILKGDPAALAAHEAASEHSGQDNVVCALCGLAPVSVVMTAARLLGATRPVLLHYSNSGQVEPRTAERSVGYGAVAFCRSSGTPTAPREEGELNATQQQFLLKLARQALAQFLRDGTRYQPATEDAALKAVRACFVTLTEAGQLRGCIGGLEARQPLYLAVRDMAIEAATEDPRFRPVTADELPRLHLEISVLSPLRIIQDPGEIVVGRHGVVVRQGWHSGVFLPQVAPEQGWDREEMLAHLCRDKAGLPANAWNNGAELSVFTAQVFGEEGR